MTTVAFLPVPARAETPSPIASPSPAATPSIEPSATTASTSHPADQSSETPVPSAPVTSSSRISTEEAQNSRQGVTTFRVTSTGPTSGNTFLTGEFEDRYVYQGTAEAGATVVVWWNNPANATGWRESLRTTADVDGVFTAQAPIGPWSGDLRFTATVGVTAPGHDVAGEKVLLRSSAETLQVGTTGRTSGADFIAGEGDFTFTGLTRPSGQITIWWNQPNGNPTWRVLLSGSRAQSNGSFSITHPIGPWPGELGFTITDGRHPAQGVAVKRARMVLAPGQLIVSSTSDSQGNTFIGGQGEYVFTGNTVPNSPVQIWWDTSSDRSNWRESIRGLSDSNGNFRISTPIGPWPATIHWTYTTGERPSAAARHTSTVIIQSPSSFTVGTTGTKIGSDFLAGTGRYVFEGTALPGSKVTIWWNNPSNSNWYETTTTTADASGRFLALVWVGPHPGTVRFTATAGTYPNWWNVTPVTVTLTAGAMQPWIAPAYSAEVGAAWRPGCPVGPNQLSKIDMNYWTPQGTIARGSIIVRSDLAQRTIAIFQAAFDQRFPISKMKLPSEYPGANDELMMADDNTSGFNCRTVVGNPYRMSPHSYGYAIDINTVKNPYYAAGRWYPSSKYSTGRSSSIPGMHMSETVFPQQFRAHGGHWGGCYRDYHHFELTTKRC